jgi:hypothetical protein
MDTSSHDLAMYITNLVASAPTLTPEQLTMLAVQLRPE